ncbi:MAG: heme exporter protein CcmB [Deltaproteobacteria bacterium]|nr:heme exporter protein CcmB [Deltaproteobacteria bacterium]
MFAIIRKDLLLELRTKETLTSLLLLGLLTLLVLSFAFEPGSDVRVEAAPGALWVAVVFAGVLGLSRSFLAERENECLQGLLLCPVDRGSIYLGKTAANFLFMTAAQVVVLPIFVFFFNLTVTTAFGGIILTMLLGMFGFSAVGTLFAAIAVRTRAREVMLPLLMIPLVVPLFIGGVTVTHKLLIGKGLDEVSQWLNLMLGFDVIFLVVGWLVFEYAVED